MKPFDILEEPGAFERRMEMRDRMKRVTGAAARSGPQELDAPFEAQMIWACMDCTRGEACAEWLSQQVGPSDPPEFCANRDRLLEEKARRRDG